MNNDTLDASIPVLTEIIAQEPDFVAAKAALLPPSPPTPSLPDAGQADEDADPATPAATLSDSQWESLERQVSARVLSQLQNRIDFVLEHRVRDSLADALQLVVEGMAAEIRRGLHHTLSDLIARAVAQEIAHLQTNQKKSAKDLTENI